MSKKKHKSGYELLKEKYEQKCNEHKQAVERYNRKQDEYVNLRKSYNILEEDNQCLNEQVAFLLDHCPFLVRWMYRKQFEKGGN